MEKISTPNRSEKICYIETTEKDDCELLLYILKSTGLISYNHKGELLTQVEVRLEWEDGEQPREVLDVCLNKLQGKSHVDLCATGLSGDICAQFDSLKCGENAKLDVYNETSSYKGLLHYHIYYATSQRVPRHTLHRGDLRSWQGQAQQQPA